MRRNPSKLLPMKLRVALRQWRTARRQGERPSVREGVLSFGRDPLERNYKTYEAAAAVQRAERALREARFETLQIVE